LYPLLIMEWVPGITLFEWTRDRCREGYVEALQIAADVWLHLVRELAQHEIIHGDLQHGNIMVSPEGHFRLVDYDCMCVPSLIGRRNLETGLPPYQHPGRNGDTLLFPGLDNFSALYIYVALRALAAAPYLWITYVDQPEYDRILFRDQDFHAPATSPLYRELLQSPDEQVRDLAHYLFELVRYDLHDVPPVDEVLLWCESIENLVTQQEWDKVVQLVQRMGPEERVAPEIQPYVQEAQQRVECRTAVEQALKQGNEERVEQLYATGLLHNYPAAAPILEAASRAAEVRPILRVLASAKQLQAWDKLKHTWLAYQHLLKGRPSAKVYEREAQKLLTVDRLRELLARPPVDDGALVEAWEYLEKLGGHALAEPYRQPVQQAAARRRSVAKLRQLLLQAPPTPTLASDKQIAAVVPRETLQSMNPADPLVPQVQAVLDRLQYVKRVHGLEKAGTVESETFIAGVLKQLPTTYHEGLIHRAEQARKRIQIHRQLVKAVESGDGDEAVLRAWELLGRVRGRILASEELQHLAARAEARQPLLQQLRAIPVMADEAERERRVVELWNPELLDDCPEAAPWRDLYQRTSGRRVILKRISQAIEAGDQAEAERLLQDPALQGRDVPPQLAKELAELRSRAQQATLAKRQAIVNALLNNQRSAFVELFDAATVGEICSQFRHHQPLVYQWLESEILPASRIGFQADLEQAVTRDDQGNLKLVWTWPPPRICRRCRLAICKVPPRPQATPEDVEAWYAVALDADQWDPQAGHQVPLDPEWEGSSVYVWAEVDLGFQLFFSSPFELGQIKPVVKQRRWGLFRGWRAEKDAKPVDKPLQEDPAADGPAAELPDDDSGEPASAPPSESASSPADDGGKDEATPPS
jgi:ribosomal protein S20